MHVRHRARRARRSAARTEQRQRRSPTGGGSRDSRRRDDAQQHRGGQRQPQGEHAGGDEARRGPSARRPARARAPPRTSSATPSIDRQCAAAGTGRAARVRAGRGPCSACSGFRPSPVAKRVAEPVAEVADFLGTDLVRHRVACQSTAKPQLRAGIAAAFAARDTGTTGSALAVRHEHRLRVRSTRGLRRRQASRIGR